MLTSRLHTSSMLFATFVLALCGWMATSVNASPLTIEYTFGTPGATTLDPVSTSPATGITVSAITLGSGADAPLVENPSNDSAPGAGYNLTSPMISVGAGTNTVNSLNQAEANDVYIQFTITPGSGYTFSLESLSLLAGRSAASSTRQWGFYTSATGFVTPVLFDDVFATRGSSSMSSEGGSLAGEPLLQDISSALTVRIYVNPGTGGSANAGRRLDLDSITLNGTVIPEPASLMLLGMGGALLMSRRRNK